MKTFLFIFSYVLMAIIVFSVFKNIFAPNLEEDDIFVGLIAACLWPVIVPLAIIYGLYKLVDLVVICIINKIRHKS